MKKLSISLKHCYGIKQMDYEFDFTHGNVIAIYARNGMMKTSLAKTFKKIKQGKRDEIKDEIFCIDGTADVKIDGQYITPEQIFVINSFENSYQADITPLLIDEAIKGKLNEVLQSRNKLFKALETMSGLRIKKIVSGKKVYELESAIIEDFNFNEKSFLVNLSTLQKQKCEIDLSTIRYSDIFDDSVIKKILSVNFQTKIQEYLSKSEEIYASYSFLSKGNLTLPKLKNVRKSLGDECYFSQDNTITLSGGNPISSMDILNQKISEIDEKLKNVAEFQAIEKLLSDTKGTSLRDLIETNPELLNWLKKDKLNELKKCLWLSYIHKNITLFEELCGKYDSLFCEIDSVNIDNTLWKQALEIYNKRFSVPYSMEIVNLKGAIIGESIPKVEFSFSEGEQTVKLSRDKLDELDTLSQGEKRALYLLNIIFEIEEIKQNEGEVLFIVDDIADSFDYKNKYAIVEYLYEIAQANRYFMIILSHNFDFYRTIASRLGLNRENRLCASIDNHNVLLVQEHYQNQPFQHWKEHPTGKNFLAMIPFVRNLVEYGKDLKIYSKSHINSKFSTDFELLTALLHEKTGTSNIKFSDLSEIYNAYLGIEAFAPDDPNANKSIVRALYDICDQLTTGDAELEDKILLSMAIRHKAESFMKDELNAYSGQLAWKKNKRDKATGNSSDFLSFVNSKSNQTRELLNGYKQIADQWKLHILENVAIMTPENIHLNSFMYEPILDMDILELLDLYKQVKAL